MRYLVKILSVFMLLFAMSSHANEQNSSLVELLARNAEKSSVSMRDKMAIDNNIKELEFKGAKLVDVIRIISELSGANIVATNEASEKLVTVYLKDVTVRQAIETICRINNLWYRQDGDTATFRIMTTDEYSKDLVIHRDDLTRIFTLRNPNVELVANAIEDLYGDRVERRQSGGIGNIAGIIGLNGSGFGSSNLGDGNFSGGLTNNSSFNSVSNNSFFNRNNELINDGTGRVNIINRERRIEEKLSTDQIAALKATGDSGNQISASQLQTLSAQEATIFLTTNFEHNLVIVRSSDKIALEDIETLVDKLDKPIPQVLLEMRIIDVLVGEDFNSIFNVEVAGGAFSDSQSPTLLGNNALPGSGTFIFSYLNDRVLTNLELLKQNKRVNVLSTPMVLASNNRPARLFVGEERILVTGYKSITSTNTVEVGGGTVVTDETRSDNIVPETEVEEVGNTIEIVPFINSDGTITLNIQQESSNVRVGGAVIPVVSEGNVLNLPTDTVNTARLQGTVIAKDNFTIAVGGLIRTTFSNNDRRLPFADVLTGRSEKEEKSELVLMITPHIIQMPDSQDDLLPQEYSDPVLKELSQFTCKEDCKK